jgi:hypothetical protein
MDSILTASNTGQLRVQTSGKYSNEQQMFAAGFLEAYLSAERIHDYFQNTYTYFTVGMNASLGEPLQWLEEQDAWARQQVTAALLLCSSSPYRMLCQCRSWAGRGTVSEDGIYRLQVAAHGDSAYWRMLGLVLRQFDGIVAGYQARHAADPSSLPPLSRSDLMFLNGNGEACAPAGVPSPLACIPSSRPASASPTFLRPAHAWQPNKEALQAANNYCASCHKAWGHALQASCMTSWRRAPC